jgi:DNA-binding transcriptional regulator YdaS (Cro superfamily)
MKPIEAIIDFVGAATIAASLDPRISVQAVYKWPGQERVAEKHCPTLERLCQGRWTCEQLRPDLTWVRTPDTDWPHPEGRPLLDLCAPKVTA